MGKVNSKLKPPISIPCLDCAYLLNYKKKHGITSYADYGSLSINDINELRTHCSSCKGAQWSGFGSGTFKADLIMFYSHNISVKTSLVGEGRTSKFSDSDIEKMKRLHEEGWTWDSIAKANNVSRQTINNLVNGKTKRIKGRRTR